MKSAMSMTATTLFLIFSGTADANEKCLTLDVEVLKVDENWKTVKRINPEREFLHYGDRIKLQVVGNRPGLFHLFTINPLNERHSNYPVIQSGGNGTVILPCGPETDTKTCAGSPGAPMILENDFSGGNGSQIEEEKIVVTYYPCATTNLTHNPEFGSQGTNSPEICSEIIDPKIDMDQFYENYTYESLRIDTKSLSCNFERDQNGNLMLTKTIIVRAVR